MKVIVDTNDPASVAEFQALVGGDAPTAPPPGATPPPPGATPPPPPPPPGATPPPPPPPPPPPASSGAPDQAGVAAAIAAYAQAHGPKQCKAKIAELSAAAGVPFSKAGDVPASHYEWFIGGMAA